MPKSTEMQRFQRVVGGSTPTMALLVTEIENCLPGPDRAAALVYLRELHGLCADLLARFPE